MTKTLLIAVGGNSLIRAGQKGTIPEQFANARLTAGPIGELAARGYRIVLTHGNGPQVGAQLLRSESGSPQTYTLPLDVCVAMTQGEIGYILQTCLQSVLKEKKISIPVTTMLTQVLVRKNDPAFEHPTKPIGPFYSHDAAERKRTELGWNIVEDAARGYRRVVPSPKPYDIIELDIIKECLDNNMIVIACGGGGIPVIAQEGSITGTEAVIDKDRASSLLASKLKIPLFIISTDVETIFLNYKKPDQIPLHKITIREAREHLEAGHFYEGSMKPKIEAAIDFLEHGGKEAIITNPEHLLEAIDGKTGTHIIRKEKQ
ncbi:MAG: carbamate kinase [Bacteroidota bacterium]